MPYLIRKSGDKFHIVRGTDGKVVGTSDNRAKAEASIRARMAGEPKTGVAKKKAQQGKR